MPRLGMYRNAVRHLSEDETKDFQRRKNSLSGNRLIVSALHETPENRVFAANISFVHNKYVDCYIDCPDYSVGYLLYGRIASWLGEPPSAS